MTWHGPYGVAPIRRPPGAPVTVRRNEFRLFREAWETPPIPVYRPWEFGPSHHVVGPAWIVGPDGDGYWVPPEGEWLFLDGGQVDVGIFKFRPALRWWEDRPRWAYRLWDRIRWT